jgi:hypothetical protein
VARVWYCRNCGYEVRSRGRCHSCGERLIASPLPELRAGPEDEEVGYELDGWSERDRGRLIERLLSMGVEHRFEDEQLIVDASDEERVDDLVAAMGEGLDPQAGTDAGDGAAPSLSLPASEPVEDLDDAMRAAVDQLAAAARRLREDPTDMQADADIGEASASVFLVERYGPFGDEAWAAIGRVTRRLLSLLGADEALEDEIRKEAAVLERLLAPAPAAPADPHEERGREWTVYEFAEWLPEQRAELDGLLEEKSIPHRWESSDLLVATEREADAEALFDSVGGTPDGDEEGEAEGDEERYSAVAELFAAAGRLASDPNDQSRRQAVLDWVGVVEGPALLGMESIAWLRIRTRARALAGAIEDGAAHRIHDDAAELHDLLRPVV